MLRPPLLVPIHASADGITNSNTGGGAEEEEENSERERIMAAMSSHLLARHTASGTSLTPARVAAAAPARAAARVRARAAAVEETRPCLDEIQTDVERLLMLRSEIVQAFSSSTFTFILQDPTSGRCDGAGDGGGDIESPEIDSPDGIDPDIDPDLGLVVREYAALLGALVSVDGIGDDCIDDLDLRWRLVVVPPVVVQDQKLGTSGVENSGEDQGMDVDDIDNTTAMKAEIMISASSLHQERRLAAYLLAALEYRIASASSASSASASTSASASAIPASLDDGDVRMEEDGAPREEGGGEQQKHKQQKQEEQLLRDAEIGYCTAATLFHHIHNVMEKAERDGRNDGNGNGNCGSSNSNGCSSSGCSSSSMLLDPSKMELFHLASLTAGQECVYRRAVLRQKKKLMHPMLAKLAAGCADWYGRVVSHVGVMQQEKEGIADEGGRTRYNDNVMEVDNCIPAAAVMTTTTPAATAAPPPTNILNPSQIGSTYQAGEYYYKSVAEQHEALAPRIQSRTGAQIGRLRRALDFARRAELELLGTGGTEDGTGATAAAVTTVQVGRLLVQISQLQTELQRMLQTVEDGNAEEVPADADLPATRGQNMMTKTLPVPPEVDLVDVGLAADCLDPPPLEQLLDDEAVRVCVDFHGGLCEMYESAKVAARKATNAAREELGRLGVEEGLNTFKAVVEAREASHRSGGHGRGIPPAMAAQIRSLHSSQGVILLRQNLYILQEVAEVARQNLDGVENMLNETARLDANFRRTNPMFRGREVDVEHGQITLPSFEDSDAVVVGAREIVARCRNLLDKAHQGDEKLRIILEKFETDPKYKLVMLPIERLERLVAESGGSGSVGSSVQVDVDRSKDETGASTVDTSALEQCLSNLDNVLAERDSNISEMQTKIEAYRLRPEMVQAIDESNFSSNESLDQLYIEVAQRSLRVFRLDIIDRLNESIKEQEQLLQSILQLHSKFQRDRAAYEEGHSSTDSSSSSPNSAMHDAYLQKIASALETIAWIQPQLIKGSTFYENFLLGISELNNQVSDVNAVMANERIMFEENNDSFQKEEMMRKQVEEDERLARELAETLTLGGNAQEKAEHEAQMRRDEQMAVELERQLREEEVNASGSNLASYPTPEERGNDDGGDQMIPEDGSGDQMIPEGGSPSLGLPPYSGGRPPRNNQNQMPMDDAANAFGLSNEQDIVTTRAAGRAMERRRSNSFYQPGRNEPSPPRNDRRRRRSSFGDVPLEIFARGGGDNVSILSMDISSLGSESIVRTHQRQQQMNERHNQVARNHRGTPQSDTAELEPAAVSSRAACASNPTDSRRSPLPGRSVRPGMVQLRNDEVEMIDVDDEAFAQLVSMDFDPDLVRDALQRFDNSFERAMEFILTHK
mmetsp:Transcript_21594/g.48239  ORF Transcript_21594/g.48239 Transcript_21594/m.48239 type:complete len:1381 (+) Transcript_21594:347-4489(+)